MSILIRTSHACSRRVGGDASDVTVRLPCSFSITGASTFDVIPYGPSHAQPLVGRLVILAGPPAGSDESNVTSFERTDEYSKTARTFDAAGLGRWVKRMRGWASVGVRRMRCVVLVLNSIEPTSESADRGGIARTCTRAWRRIALSRIRSVECGRRCSLSGRQRCFHHPGKGVVHCKRVRIQNALKASALVRRPLTSALPP